MELAVLDLGVQRFKRVAQAGRDTSSMGCCDAPKMVPKRLDSSPIGLISQFAARENMSRNASLVP
jgi:hypothetical protein